MKRLILFTKPLLTRLLPAMLFVLLWIPDSNAQNDGASYKIRNGRTVIEVSRKIKHDILENFISQYDLYELTLPNVLQSRNIDTLRKLGWIIEQNDASVLRASKPLTGFEDLDNPVNKILFTEKQPSFSAMFPVVSSGVLYGVNTFKGVIHVSETDSAIVFRLNKYPNARQVILSGSFSNWSPAIPMYKTAEGWECSVRLRPGKYWYKFIVDGNWITDPSNFSAENDGLGNVNSVVFKSNHLFYLKGFTSAKRVYVSGSFNNWERRELQMQPTDSGWRLPIYLGEGTHRYRFIVDGRWMADPANVERLPNEFNDFNSIVRIGKVYTFHLNGYLNASEVFVFGSFNSWRRNELLMKKVSDGWQLPYTLGAGNYEYNFSVDGKMVSPAEHGSEPNFNLIIDSNYTFELKGYAGAKSVYLAGDFNGWSPNAFPMHRNGDKWTAPVHLSPGKHLYKFVVDGKWIIDPANKLWEQNEHNTGNSVIWIEEKR